MRRAETRQSGLLARLRSALGLSWWRGASWSDLTSPLWGDVSSATESQLSSPAAQNTHVYRAVSAIALAVADAAPRLTRANGASPVTSGPAADLIARPAPHMSWQDLAEEIAQALCYTGAAFVLDADLVDTPASWSFGPPRRLAVISQNLMAPRLSADRRRLIGWDYYDPAGRRMIAAELAPYVRLPHPDDPWIGLAPLAACLLGVKQDYKAAVYNAAALDNGGQPGGQYLWPDDPGEERRREIQDMIRARHSGPGRANKPAFLWGGAKFEPTSVSNVDLQLIEARKLSRDEIFEAFGVPPVIAAVYERAHYDVADASIEIFLTHTLRPLCRKIAALFNRFVLPLVEPGVELTLDVSDHPVMQRLIEKRLVSLGTALKAAVPWNKAKDLLRLPLDDEPWGDQPLIEAGTVTLDDVLAGLRAAPEEAPVSPQSDEASIGGMDDSVPRMSAAILDEERRSEERQTRAAVRVLLPRIRAVLLRQQRAALAVLRAELAGSDAARQCAAPIGVAAPGDGERVAARIALAMMGTNADLKRLVHTLWRGAVEQTLRAELTRLGVSEAEATKAVTRALGGRFVRALLATKELRIVSVTSTQASRARRALLAGLGRGESVQEIAERVRNALDVSRARALTIARTEATQAVGTARFMAAQAAGARAKAWMTGANPRATHAQAGRDYSLASPIAMEASFIVGSSRLMYPRDPRGEAGEIINCNCTLLTLQRKTDTQDGAWLVVSAIGTQDTRSVA